MIYLELMWHTRRFRTAQQLFVDPHPFGNVRDDGGCPCLLCFLQTLKKTLVFSTVVCMPRKLVQTYIYNSSEYSWKKTQLMKLQ